MKTKLFKTPPHAPSLPHVHIVPGTGQPMLVNNAGSWWTGSASDLATVQALEEVAWRKEADRLDESLGQMCERNIQRYNARGKTVGIENTQELRMLINAAEDNALAWRAWEANYE